MSSHLPCGGFCCVSGHSDDPPSEVVANRPVANGRGVVGAYGWGWVMGWANRFFLLGGVNLGAGMIAVLCGYGVGWFCIGIAAFTLFTARVARRNGD